MSKLFLSDLLGRARIQPVIRSFCLSAQLVGPCKLHGHHSLSSRSAALSTLMATLRPCGDIMAGTSRKGSQAGLGTGSWRHIEHFLDLSEGQGGKSDAPNNNFQNIILKKFFLVFTFFTSNFFLAFWGPHPELLRSYSWLCAQESYGIRYWGLNMGWPCIR